MVALLSLSLAESGYINSGYTGIIFKGGEAIL